MQMRPWIALSALLAGSVAVTAPLTATLAAQGPRGFGGGFGPGFGPGPGKVVSGEPFTASETSSSVDTLAGGTTITHNSTITEARDTEGRTVRTVTGTNATGSSVTRTTVMDPVAHTITSWGSQSTVATVVQLPSFTGGKGGNWAGPGGQGPGGQGGGTRPHPQAVRVSLGSKTIAGVTADGTRTTITIPAGAEGNDKPLVSIREVWTSPTLQIVLLETNVSPREGSHTLEVTALNQNAPDPSLFQPPANYTVKQQTRHRGA